MPIIELTIDGSGALTGAQQYEAATNQISRQTTETESAMSKMRSGINKLGPIFAAAGAAAGTAFIALGKSAIDAASSMEETQNKFDVVFAGMTQSAEAWAAGLVQNYSMSNQEAKQFLASTQDLLKPMGVAAEQAGQMSNSVAQLSADLGSFNDLPTAQVMGDIQSALVGNFETMKKYGVVLNAAAVEQEAYNSGLAKQGEDLTAAQKAQAAYQLILQGTKDAQGDMARSADSYANQMKKLQSQIKNVQIELGKKLLPVATKIITAFTKWLSVQGNLDRIINGFVETLRFLYNAFKGIEVALKGVIVAIAKFAEFTVDAFRAVLSPVDLVFKGIEKFGGPNNPFDLATEATQQFSASAVEALMSTWDEIETTNTYFDDMRQKTEESAGAVDDLTGSMGNATLAGSEMNDTLGTGAEKSQQIATNMSNAATSTQQLGQSTGVTSQMMNALLNSLQMIQNSLLQLVRGQQQAGQTAQQASVQTSQYKNSVDTLSNSAARAAQNVSALAGAQQAAAAAPMPGAGGGAGGGGGPGYTTGMTGARSGRFNLPGWFSDDMISAYGRHASDVLIKGTPHLGPLAGGPGNAPSRSMRDRRSDARREWYQQQYDPSRFAAQWLQQQGIADSGGNVTTESGFVINLYQEMSKDQIEALIAELERAGIRQ